MVNKYNLLAISGKAGSGKNLTADIIQYLLYCKETGSSVKFGEDYQIETLGYIHNFKQKSFAFKVKQILSILTGIPIRDFEKEEVKSSYLGEEWNRWVIVINPDHNLFDGNCLLEDAYFSTEEEATRYVKEFKIINCDHIELQKITVRQAMQLVGTDLFRDKFHPQTWVNALFSDYKEGKKDCGCGEGLCDTVGTPLACKFKGRLYPNWLITDLRFKNEAQAIKDIGGIIIRINRVTGNCLLDNDTHAITDWQHSSETELDNYDNFHYIIDNNGSIEELIEKVKDILIALKLI